MKLNRHPSNPILAPDPSIWWKNQAVLNPGVVFDGEKVHMVYRAIGRDTISRLGYAVSTDGINFTESLEPIFEPERQNSFETLGCEDPRITQIGDKFYITYTAVSITRSDDWDIRVSLARTANFLEYDRLGVALPDCQSKNAVLFPHKLDGMYLMLHRVNPDIWFARSSNLTDWRDHQPIISPRPGMWDEFKVGAGAPPILTPYGWLLFYHGVDRTKVYRLGIALLDIDDPRNVLYRSHEPVFEPEVQYEKTGDVNNVVFACGTIEKGGEYLIYYGAGDKHICVASISKGEVFAEIEQSLPVTGTFVPYPVGI